jgi:hypothetical protein
MQQSQAQQSAFSSALQAQIDAANKQSQQFADTLLQERTSFENEMRAQSSAYEVNTSQVTPANSQVTQAPQPKARERSTLKIEPGATEALVGSGLNIGF